MSEAPRLLLHVGVHKTGTTAIQSALAALRPDLAGRGIAYPDLRPVTGGSVRDHNALAHAIAHEGLRAGLRRWRLRRALLAARGRARTVLSAEAIARHTLGRPDRADPDSWFAAHDAYLARLARFLRNFEVQALCYLRQPETAVVSMFKENVVRGMGDGRLEFPDFLRAKAARFDYPRVIRSFTYAFTRLEVLSYEAETKTGLLTGVLARCGAPDLAPPDLPEVRSSPSNRATMWLQAALGKVPPAEYRHRAVFALRPAGLPWFREDRPSTLWPSDTALADFVQTHAASYDLPFLRRPAALDLPVTIWTPEMHAAADRAFADWANANRAMLQARDRLGLRHYDADPLP